MWSKKKATLSAKHWGRQVNIFQKPHTDEDFEGVAMIREVTGYTAEDQQGRIYNHCWVWFKEDEDENGNAQCVERYVAKRHLV